MSSCLPFGKFIANTQKGAPHLQCWWSRIHFYKSPSRKPCKRRCPRLHWFSVHTLCNMFLNTFDRAVGLDVRCNSQSLTQILIQGFCRLRVSIIPHHRWPFDQPILLWISCIKSFNSWKQGKQTLCSIQSEISWVVDRLSGSHKQ